MYYNCVPIFLLCPILYFILLPVLLLTLVVIPSLLKLHKTLIRSRYSSYCVDGAERARMQSRLLICEFVQLRLSHVVINAACLHVEE